MKTVWTIIVTIALANILAMAGVIGWLGMTNRLSADRVDALRAMFQETVSEQKSREESEAASKEAERNQLFESARRGALPVGVTQLNDDFYEQQQIEQRRVDRDRDDVARMEEQLAERRSAFEADVQAFEAEREAFEEMREEIRAREGDDQFQKSLKTLESLQPEAAHSMLNSMLEEGKKEEVVAYISEMAARSRTKLISQFQTQDPAVAADLLERLRTYGIDAATP